MSRPLGAHADAFVEALQISGFVLETELSEIPPQGVQRLRHRVAGGEIVLFEQRFEDRPRQGVLRHHFDGVIPADRGVDRDLELLVESVEPFAQGFVIGTGQKSLDPVDEPREDICNVSGPGLPVFPVPASLDDLGEYRAGWQVERRKGQFGGALSVEPIAAEDDPIGRRVIEVDLVDLGIEPVIVRA